MKLLGVNEGKHVNGDLFILIHALCEVIDLTKLVNREPHKCAGWEWLSSLQIRDAEYKCELLSINLEFLEYNSIEV